MNIELIGATIDTTGKILIAYTAMSVHYRFWKEHKIDQAVFHSMRRERNLGIVGVILILLGFLLEHLLPALGF